MSEKFSQLPKYKPIPRWAEGKNWLIKSLPALIGNIEFASYHEPFLGGGFVFFALAPEQSFLSDLSGDLIDAYIGLRDEPEQVIELLRKWPVSESEYYRIHRYSSTKPSSKAARFRRRSVCSRSSSPPRKTSPAWSRSSSCLRTSRACTSRQPRPTLESPPSPPDSWQGDSRLIYEFLDAWGEKQRQLEDREITRKEHEEWKISYNPWINPLD